MEEQAQQQGELTYNQQQEEINEAVHKAVTELN